MFWTETDSDNLARIALALETIAGIKSFIPNKGSIKIEVVEDNEEEQEETKVAIAKANEILQTNEGKYLWEETNLSEDDIDREYL